MGTTSAGNSERSLSTEELLDAYNIPSTGDEGKARARRLLAEHDRRRTPARRAALRETVRPPEESAA